MAYRLVVQPEAQAEVERIYDHLESERSDLGERFLDAFEECLLRIQRYPFGLQLRRAQYRHAPIRGFNYRVVYAVDTEGIFIYQVRHTSRRPSERFGP
jgi:plasmid stabilization system protein ParE